MQKSTICYRPPITGWQEITKMGKESEYTGIFVGVSPSHSSTISLVLNICTYSITPQFHVTHNEWFTAIYNSDVVNSEKLRDTLSNIRRELSWIEDQYAFGKSLPPSILKESGCMIRICKKDEKRREVVIECIIILNQIRLRVYLRIKFVMIYYRKLRVLSRIIHIVYPYLDNQQKTLLTSIFIRLQLLSNLLLLPISLLLQYNF